MRRGANFAPLLLYPQYFPRNYLHIQHQGRNSQTINRKWCILLCNLPALPSPMRFFNERTFNSKCHRVFFKRGHVLKKRGRVLKKDGHVLKKDGGSVMAYGFIPKRCSSCECVMRRLHFFPHNICLSYKQLTAGDRSERTFS